MKARQEIKRLFQEAITSLNNDYKGSSLTDIFVVVDEDSGEISIFDDEENNIANGIIHNWRDSDKKPINYTEELRAVVTEMDDEDCFSTLELYTPFSINLADEDFVVIEELLLIEDESIIRIEDEFIKRMDKEFDDFLDKLLKS